MDAQTVSPLLTAKIVGSYLDIIQSGPASFLTSSPPCTEVFASLDDKRLSKKCSSPLSRCGNLCVPTMWFASIAATGGKPCAATLAADTA
jgi:hypothetical protein